jgi:glycosyltransferase involved in cell wall biosynthesis
MRIAIVHDYIYTVGGAEKVLKSMLECFPGADLYTLFDTLPPERRAQIGYSECTTSFLQKMPGITQRHRLYLPLMPLAVEQLDVSSYELVISSSWAVAKGVLTGPDQLHISYVHSPMRYAWDLQHEYLRVSGLERGVKSWIARALLHRLRLWDVRTANGVDDYVANSHFIARRIGKAYGRAARVIYPPVAVPPALPAGSKDDFFMTASRLVPYKNVDKVVQAFRHLPDEKLMVVGDGPEMHKIKQLAGDNVTFTGFVSNDELHTLFTTARAFIFAAEEDFGIAPVEAQAHGTPVLALRRGAARETVVERGDEPTGIFFDSPTPECIAHAVSTFVRMEQSFRGEHCHANAHRFSEERFINEFSGFVNRRFAEFERGMAETAERLAA